MGAELIAFLGIAALVIVTPGQDTALTIRNGLQTLWGRRARGAVRRPRVRRSLDALMGSALVALGLRLAAEER
jgi:threonine/homoserine/homoserine lactone efflux protein